ncbi:homogentisate phytyltransferase [Solirubrobacter phytolaccae]|uniref:Homogentisate phytyltransferase n=1 Tax=Solirubrobacter phytolaccae TaxID=1404360 RepID=A0A9X3NEP7_9ACTN|nr:homogentisate phytyltransferase [Solirubrobacter phytolaccae]MDA0183924.1 homogentisate phytyltransferase [Solirubrobacter phytolaccae]
MSGTGTAPQSRAAVSARANPVLVLWRFSRPHTVIGTALSVLGLWAIAATTLDVAPPVWDLVATLVAGLAVNVAIVGVNQLTDVEIDRVNKPFLPIAAGELSLRAATVIVVVCSVLPLGMALTQGAVETGAVAAGLAVGALYSLPPFRLKRYPVAASLCISGVRSVVVNLGVYWHFAGRIDPPVVALCLFVLPFSLAIAILKDVPDLEGDRRYSIRTFTVRLGPERVFRAGLAALFIAYAGMIVVAPPLLTEYANPFVLALGHALAAGLLLHWARAANPSCHTEFTRFYMRVWMLFFLEYLLVPAACLANW